jgi:hypothetical protein
VNPSTAATEAKKFFSTFANIPVFVQLRCIQSDGGSEVSRWPLYCSSFR